MRKKPPFRKSTDIPVGDDRVLMSASTGDPSVTLNNYKNKKKTIEEKSRKSKVTSISFFGGKCRALLTSLSLATQMIRAEAQTDRPTSYFHFSSQDNSCHYAWLSYGIPKWFFALCNATSSAPDTIGRSLGQPCPRAISEGDDPYGELYTTGNTTTALTPIIECIYDGMKESCVAEINFQKKALTGIGIGFFILIVGVIFCIWRQARFAAMAPPPLAPAPLLVEELADIPLQNVGVIHNRSLQNPLDDDIIYGSSSEDKNTRLSF